MSAKQVTGAFAIAILISFIAPSNAQEANVQSTALAENSWDFTNPNSIPGFGTLPQNYDTRAVLPKFSGK